MAFEFQLEVRPSRSLAIFIGLIHALVPLALVQLWSVASQSFDLIAFLLIVVASLALTLWSFRRLQHVQPAGRLWVAHDGHASWVRGPNLTGFSPGSGAVDMKSIAGRWLLPSVQRFQPLVWCRIGPMIWIDGRCSGVRLRLLLGRDSYSDDHWRALNSWLTWLQRAPHRLDVIKPPVERTG